MKAFFSMNNHQVATPEMMLEEARSYIMFFQEAGGKLSVYIGLHLLQSGRKLFYAHSSNPFQTGEMESVEDEALGFVEGLGALLDAIDFTKLSDEEKDRWLDQQDIFSKNSEATAEEKHVETADQDAPSTQHEPQTAQAPSAVPESASQVQQPPQVQPAAPVQQVPPVQDEPQASQPLQQPTPPAAYTSQTPPVPPDRPASETQSPPPSGHESRRYGAPEIPAQTQGHEHRFPAQKAPTPAAMQRAPFGAPAKDKREIIEKSINAVVIKPPKPSLKREAPSATGVVSRDREALARLLTSF